MTIERLPEPDNALCECGDLFIDHQKPPLGTPWDICSFPCLKCKCTEFREVPIDIRQQSLSELTDAVLYSLERINTAKLAALGLDLEAVAVGDARRLLDHLKREIKNL